MCARLAAVLLGVSLWAAQTGTSVDRLVALVRSEIQHKQADKQVAKALHKVQLTERLDDRTIEVLDSEGAGPQALAELVRLRDDSRNLPKPSAAAPGIETPPRPSGAGELRVWESAREIALNYTASLPDFICTEVVRRYTREEEKDKWKLTDTLQVRLSFFERRESYKLVAINNRPTNRSFRDAGGAVSEGEFGTLLRNVFAADSETAHEWDHWTTLRRRLTHVYFFRINVLNSRYWIESGVMGLSQRTTVGQHGYIYVDGETNRVVRIAAEADSIPPSFPVRMASQLVDYDFTEVGGRPYLLPLRAESVIGGLAEHKNELEFRQYQKFAADATISFDSTEPQEKRQP